jgi:hypothetical protein
MSVKLSLDFEDIELGDLELFEEATGLDFVKAVQPVPVIDPETGRKVPDPDDPKGRPLMEVLVNSRTLIGMVYIVKKHENPEITLAEVKKIKFTDIEFDDPTETAEEADPTETAETPPEVAS